MHTYCSAALGSLLEEVGVLLEGSLGERLDGPEIGGQVRVRVVERNGDGEGCEKKSQM